MHFSRVYGGLKDQDRIFTNLYKDGDPFVEGALKRVRLPFVELLIRATGIKPRTSFSTVPTVLSMRSRSPVSVVEAVLVSPPD